MIVVDFTPEKKADSRQHRPVNVGERHTLDENVKYIHCDTLGLRVHLEVSEHAIYELETFYDHLSFPLF